MLAEYGIGDVPLTAIEPADSEAVVLPWSAAQEEAAVELVFVIEIDVIQPTAA